jgi:ribose transport system permease protein
MTTSPRPERSDVTEALPVPRTEAPPAAETLREQSKTGSGRRGGGGGAPSARPSKGVGAYMAQYSLVILLVASFLLYTFWGKTGDIFFSTANLSNVAGSQAIPAILTLGLLIPMVSGNLDLSIGSTAGLSAIATAGLYSETGAPLFVGVLFGIAMGLLVGLVNGLLVTYFQIDSFIITLGTAAIILGAVNWYSKGVSILQGIPQDLVGFGSGKFLGVPKLVYVLVVVAFLVWYLLEQTPYGRNLHAIGSNKAASRLVGIRVERDIQMSFVLSGGLSGLGGVLLVANAGSANPQIGQQFTLPAIAAAFLGAACFKLGKLNVLGSLVAIYFLQININGLSLAGVANWISEVFTGLSLILAIIFTGVLSRRALKTSAKAAQSSAAEKPKTA